MLEFLATTAAIYVMIRFWKLMLFVASFGFGYLFLKGIFAIFSNVRPPLDEWQYPWDLTHGHMDGNEVFWTIVFALIAVAIGWYWYRRLLTRLHPPKVQEI